MVNVAVIWVALTTVVLLTTIPAQTDAGSGDEISPSQCNQHTLPSDASIWADGTQPDFLDLVVSTASD
jgi:hypothetical protein